MFFLHFLPVPFSACEPATLTLERLADDCIEFIGHLCRTLGKGKVYLIGGSWWTELGDFCMRQGPERVAGYIGYGEVVNGVEKENRSYVFVLPRWRRGTPIPAGSRHWSTPRARSNLIIGENRRGKIRAA